MHAQKNDKIYIFGDKTMGSYISKIISPRSPIVEQSDGGLEEFQSRYVEENLLGEGEFGKVKLFYEMKINTLRVAKESGKGAQFKGNSFYCAYSADVLLRPTSAK